MEFISTAAVSVKHPAFHSSQRTGIPGMNLHCFQRKFFHSPPHLTPIQLPSPMETHLWYVKPCEVRSESLLSEYWDILSTCEKETVLRMQGDELRKIALLSRALVRTTIARYQMNSQVSPESLKFRKNSYGKPEVDWGFSDDCQPPPTYFSEHEVKFLDAIADPEVRRQEFIKLWTLKEAYVKALGRGFSGAPFKTFTIRFNGVTGETIHRLKDLQSEASEIAVDSFDDPSNHTSHWQFVLLELAGSHYAAICTEKHCGTEGKRNTPVKLTAWKTIPFLEDEQVSGTDYVKPIHGLE